MYSIIPSTSDQSHEFLLQSRLEAPITSGNGEIEKRSGSQQPTRQARVVLRLYREAGTWSKLASELGVNRGLLWKVAHGRIRYSRKVRKALRLRRWQHLMRWWRVIQTGGVR